MEKYPDFWSVLLGNGGHGYFFGYSVLAILAAFGMILIRATSAYKDAEGSPTGWSWKYFWADNLGKIVAGFFLLPIFIRFVYEYIDRGWMLAISIGIGFGFFGLARIATNFGIWTTKNLSTRIAETLKQKEVSVEEEKKP